MVYSISAEGSLWRQRRMCFNTLPLLWMLKLSHFWPVATSSTWFLSHFYVPRVISYIFLGFGGTQCPRFICVSVVLDPKSVKYLRSPGPFTASVRRLHFYRTILGLNCSLENVFNLFLYFIKNTFFPPEIKMIVDAIEPWQSVSCSDKTQMVGHNNYNKI